MKLSLCMIVKDEAANLPHCLSSVRGVVDEAIVVDTGSTDGTIAVAQSFAEALNLKVYQFSWCHDFSAARNYSLQYAQAEWILVLDADEILRSEIVPVLRQAIQSADALVVNLLRYEVGAAQAPYSLLSRLFRRHPALQFQRPYHELIDDRVLELLHQEPHWKILELPGVAIHHTGYQANVIAQRQKSDRARRLMEAYLQAHPDDAYLCNKLGALYADRGELPRSLELLQRGLAVATIEPPVAYELHYHLAEVHRHLGNWQQAEQHFRAALEQAVSPRLKLSIYTNWGSLKLDRNDPQGAKTLFEQAVTIAPEFAIGHFNLGMAWKALGNLGTAIDHYQQAIHLNPSYAEAHQNLGVALLKAGQVAASLDVFRQAIALYEQQSSPEGDRLRQGLESMGLL